MNGLTAVAFLAGIAVGIGAFVLAALWYADKGEGRVSPVPEEEK